jgi:hypothetical protein
MSEISEIGVRPALKPETSAEERTWAALAHFSTLLTLLVAVATLGIGGVVFAFVPLAIYLAYKDKSDYVAYHAAQALALQVLMTVGFLAAFLAGLLAIVVVWVVTALLIAILVGLILIPVALLITLVLTLALVFMPFVAGAFSLAAGIQTAGGADYEYPYIGRWVRDWLKRSSEQAAPAV